MKRKLFAGNGNPPPKDDPIKHPARQPAEPLNPADDGTESLEDTSDKK